MSMFAMREEGFSDSLQSVREVIAQLDAMSADEKTKAAKRSRTILTDTLLFDLAVIRRNSALDYNDAVEALRETLKLTVKAVNTAVDQVEEQRPAAVEANMQEMMDEAESGDRTLRTVGEVMQDAPGANLLIPPGYELEPSGTYKIIVESDTDAKRVRIAASPILITGITDDATTEMVQVRVEWLWAGQWKREILSNADIGTANGLTRAAAKSLPVNSINARDIIAYLAAFKEINERRQLLPIMRTTQQLGWQGEDGKDGFLVGRTLIMPDGSVIDGVDVTKLPPSQWRPGMIAFKGVEGSEGSAQIADAFATGGTVKGWIEAMKLVCGFARPMAAFYASMAAPLLMPLGIPNHVMDLANPSSSGKTTSIMGAASAHGRPVKGAGLPSVMLTWEGSKVYIERAQASTCDLPFFLDDTKHAARDPEKISEVIYSAGQGVTKPRGNVKGIDPVMSFRSVLISTGEAPAISYSAHGGVKGRTLTLRGMPFGATNEATRKIVERFKAAVAENYGWAVRILVRYVITNRDKWPQWRERYKALVEQYAQNAANSVAGRLGEYAAGVHIAGEITHEAFEAAGYKLPWDFNCPLLGMWDSVTREADDVDGSEKVLDLLMASLNKAAFWHISTQEKAPSDGWHGVWAYHRKDWQWVAIRQDIVDRFITSLRDGAYSPEEIKSNWKSRGYLDVAEGRKFDKQVRCDGGPRWFVVIKNDAFNRNGTDDVLDSDGPAGPLSVEQMRKKFGGNEVA